VGTMYNYRLLRATTSLPMKVLGVAGVTLLSLLAYVIIAALVQALMRGGTA
jgi:hypothetical protein